MSRQRNRVRYRSGAAVVAAVGLALAAAACSSSASGSGGGNAAGGKVTISVNCAPPAAQQPIQHKEWVEDVAIFEKANPDITIKSVYNYPCETAATFTAMLRAGNEPDLFYSYFTDLPQILLAGQAADITPYVNSKTVPTLNDIVPGSMKAVTAGKTIYGLPTSNYTQGIIYNRSLFQQAGLTRTSRRPRGRRSRRMPRPSPSWVTVSRAGVTTAPATTAAGTSRHTSTLSAVRW
jgi:ABC-type glycerol-3-phosphate transport system substrate-binding protein